MGDRSLVIDLVIFLIALCGLFSGCQGAIVGSFVGPHILIVAACQFVVGAIAAYILCHRLLSRPTGVDRD
jgi:hypothetical protein